MKQDESFGTVRLPGGGRILLYRAEKTVSVCDLAPLCGTSARELCERLRKGYLLSGEWAALPVGNLRFCRVGADGDPFSAAKEWGGEVYLPQSAADGKRYDRAAESTNTAQTDRGMVNAALRQEEIRKENALPFFYVGCAVAMR